MEKSCELIYGAKFVQNQAVTLHAPGDLSRTSLDQSGNVQISGFTKAFENFAKFFIAFIFAKFKYLAKQIIYLESPYHALQNGI